MKNFFTYKESICVLIMLIIILIAMVWNLIFWINADIPPDAIFPYEEYRVYLYWIFGVGTVFFSIVTFSLIKSIIKERNEKH